eukprot:scaffold101524_cov37-Prasinocladus_malaysianus.AAC.2
MARINNLSLCGMICINTPQPVPPYASYSRLCSTCREIASTARMSTRTRTSLCSAKVVNSLTRTSFTAAKACRPTNPPAAAAAAQRQTLQI